MKSGLEDRNNPVHGSDHVFFIPVSMKSGLEDRNNVFKTLFSKEPLELSQ